MRSGALPTATGGRYASAARAFISPTAFEQAREALWEREATGSGLQGGAACLHFCYTVKILRLGRVGRGRAQWGSCRFRHPVLRLSAGRPRIRSSRGRVRVGSVWVRWWVGMIVRF